MIPMLITIFTAIAIDATPPSPTTADPLGDLRVLVWNIQRGANHFERGPEKTLAVIRDAAPDICLLQESYDIDGDRPQLGAWLAGELGWRTWQATSPHLCVLTRLDIEAELFHADWHGVGARLRDEEGCGLVVCSTWIDYRNYLPYALRDDATISNDDMLKCETETSDRIAQDTVLIAHLRDTERIDSDLPLLVGGDWNCPSHLDWTDDAARQFRLRRSLDLPVSRAMQDAGLRDTFREVHPDPTRTPGVTWSPLYRGTAAAPEPSDRIDRLYVNDAKSAWQLVPVAGQVLPRVLEDMSIPGEKRAFPSDHGALVIDFEWRARD